MVDSKIYEDIALRTDGDIYLGVVGPVRTGKSTFIKRFMETLVIPKIDNIYMKERAKDELPQGGSGRTITTAEPKFVPEEAVDIELESGVRFSVRLIDCVGYMVEGAVGQFEGDAERMVMTPWFDHEIKMSEAAEMGTYKVITEHSTIGLVVTTDGTICGIPRENYVEPEARVISELTAIGKPFVIILNSANPELASAQELREELSELYGVNCICVNCLELNEMDVADIIKSALFEFPIAELGIYLPPWIDALPTGHDLRKALYSVISDSAQGMSRIRDIHGIVDRINGKDMVSEARIRDLSLGTGVISASIELPRKNLLRNIECAIGFCNQGRRRFNGAPDRNVRG